MIKYLMTKVDADHWKRIICSKFYGTLSTNLAQSIATFAKQYCTEDIKPELLKEFLARRLVPLDKNPGVRPTGVGEVIRRIVSKAVTRVLKNDIQDAVGTLQTCSGQQSGIEAAVHAMRRSFEWDATEAMMLVDADNAFNRLNRSVVLNNVKNICPPFHRFLNNSYQEPVKLYLSGSKEGKFIWSKEGATQGDPAAMAMYGLGIRPLMDKLADILEKDTTKQAWYADDAAASGNLQNIKKWWNELLISGPKCGYFPKPSKTYLIVKDVAHLSKAKDIFGDTGVNITLEGERHLGAVIGSDEFRQEFVRKKVSGWINDIKQLANIAHEEPQLAYAAFTKALCMRWSYVQRTIKNISHLFVPLEAAIRNTLIPAIIGREISDIDRRILGLPLRYGGMGILNPVETADREYEASVKITESLAELIFQQNTDIRQLDEESVQVNRKFLKQSKEQRLQEECKEIAKSLSDKRTKALEMSCESGSSAWLSALPLEHLGYILNKTQFRDAVCLRYEWAIDNVPSFCVCGEKNDVNHMLICKRGGYTSYRHDAIKEVEAEFLREVCKDVSTEPHLLPVEPKNFRTSANTGDQARLDIVATGLWGPFERTFFDVRVTHPNAPSYDSMTPQQLYKHHEAEKKRQYNNRVLEVEKASFCPLVYSTSGGVGPECKAYHRRVVQLISEKRREDYASVMNYVRTKIRFTLLKSVLMAIRGTRSRRSGSQFNKRADPICAIPFGLIPEKRGYETM